MSVRLFGVPLIVLFFICVAIATAYCFVWPVQKAVGADGISYFILRWFHPMAWMLLATACLTRILGGVKAVNAAKLISFLALPTYVAFFLVNALR